jgi:ADP-ribose pyrophosphatase
MKSKVIKKYKGPTATFKEVEVKIRGKKIKGNVVEFPRTVAVLPLIEKDKIILVRQYRFPPKKDLWEIPAGRLEKREDPREGAKRELVEETGFSAGKLEKIGEFFITPGYSTEYMYFFKAKKLRKGKQCLDEEELIKLDEEELIKEVKEFKLKEALKMIKSGKIQDIKTAFAIFYLMLS